MDLTIIKDIDGFVIGVVEGHVKPCREVADIYDRYGSTLHYISHNPMLELDMTLDNALDGGIGVLSIDEM